MMMIKIEQENLLWASYLRYEGNSSAGSDCDRENDFHIPMVVVKHAANQSEQIGFVLEEEKVAGFGKEVKVGGTVEQWDDAWLQVAQDISKQLVPNPSIVEVSKKGDRYYLLSLHGGQECELFKFPPQPHINAIKNGFVPIDLKGRYFFAWAEELIY